jgi:hypothetical protein
MGDENSRDRGALRWVLNDPASTTDSALIPRHADPLIITDAGE